MWWGYCPVGKKQLGPEFARFSPRLSRLPMPGDLTTVNIESLLAEHPQVVFVANYAPPEMIEQIASAGIPVVAVSLRKDQPGEQDKLNPAMADEELAYNEGLKEGIRLVAAVVNRQPQGEAMVSAVFAARDEVAARLKDLPADRRVRVYMANPDLTTYGSGKYTGLMMQHAGALNVAAASVKGFKQVSMEQVLAWNPRGDFCAGSLSGSGRANHPGSGLANHRRGAAAPGIPDAGICQGLGLSDAGSVGHR